MKKANSAAPAVPRRPGVGALSKGKLLRRLWRYLGRNRLLVLALTLSVSSSLLSLYGPKLSGQAINAIDLGAGKVDFDTVFRCAALMAVFYLLSAVLTYLLNAVMIRLSRRVSRQMRHDVFENLAALPVSFFDRYQTGDIISTITYDVDTVNQSLSSDLLQILQSVVTVVVSFIMMLTIAPKLVLIFVVTIPVTVLFTRWLAGRVRPMFRRRSAKLGVLNGYVEEMLSGQKTVRAYGQEAAVLAGFDEKNRDAVDAYTVAESYGTITGPSVNFINNVSLSLVCIFGSVLFLRGEIGLGDLSSFVQYSRKFSGRMGWSSHSVPQNPPASEISSIPPRSRRFFPIPPIFSVSVSSIHSICSRPVTQLPIRIPSISPSRRTKPYTRHRLPGSSPTQRR